MIFRKARPEDAEQAAVWIRAAIKEIAETLTGEQEESAILRVLGEFFQKPGNRVSFENTYVCEMNGSAVGLVIAYHGKDAARLDRPIAERIKEKSGQTVVFDQEADEQDFYLDTISVDERHRGKGIGTSLIRYVEEYASCKGIRRVSLLVEQGNKGAASLYDRLGYKKVKERRVSGSLYDYLVKEIAEP